MLQSTDSKVISTSLDTIELIYHMISDMSQKDSVYLFTDPSKITPYFHPSHYSAILIKSLVLYSFSYIPPRLRSRSAVFSELSFGMQHKAIITGDMNSQLPSLQNGHNRKGRDLEAQYMAKCYECHNIPFTPTMTQSTNVLDLLLARQSSAINISPLQVLNTIGTTSNHYPISFSVTLNRPFLIPRKIRFHLLGQNIPITEEFRRLTDKFILNNDYQRLSTSAKWSLLQDAVLYAGEKATGVVDSFQAPESEFTEYMYQLVRIRDQLRKRLSTNNRLSDHRRGELKTRLNLFNNKIKKERFKINKDNFDSYLGKINQSPNNVFYELCKYKNKSKSSTVHSKCDLNKTKQYYTNHFHNHQSEWHPIPYCITKQEHDDVLSLFTFDNIKHAVQTANATKASGDNVPARALKHLSNKGIKLLQSIYIQSYLEAAVPYQWQNSRIVEVFKSGDLLDPGRFRPICLISIAFKSYQQLLYYSYFRSLLLAGSRQHGFQEKKSTITQLMIVIDKILELIRNGEDVFGCAMDLSKAFDCLRHLIIGSFVAGNDKITTHTHNILQNIISMQKFHFAEILLKSNWHLVGVHHKVVLFHQYYLHLFWTKYY